MKCGTIIRSRWGSGAVFPINGRLSDECLNNHLFTSYRHARNSTEEWRIDYDVNRPHEPRWAHPA
ncbi:MAG: hypothetical protein EOQ69_31890 [Mesorhizobium sp.]|nr:MAG: hypothetical protein EOQ69_31890 [Mesorhizobium sp.]